MKKQTLIMLAVVFLLIFCNSLTASELAHKTDRLSLGRRSAAAVSIGNKAFFAGGRSPTARTDLVDIYDAEENSWYTAR